MSENRGPVAHGEAPGRVNLIGEHTDYNGGFVLPAAIPQRTRVTVRMRQDGMVRARSANVEAEYPSEYAIGSEQRRGEWIDYVAGITDVLRRAGRRVGGFDLEVSSTIPIGSGLSSSAALEIALLRALRTAFALPLDDVQLAVLGRRAENEFVGAPVGIMDQMACALADERTALFLDTRALTFERVALPAGLELAVISSGVAHNHAAGDYRTRRAECEAAAAALGVRELRDCGVDALPRIAALRDPLGRRARHVVTENARVLDTVDALRAGDLARVGALFNASHQSMRDDFEVSVPQIDLLVSLAQTRNDVYGARLTGGGFGGSIVIAARSGAARRAAARISAEYARESGLSPAILVPLELGAEGTVLGMIRADDAKRS